MSRVALRVCAVLFLCAVLKPSLPVLAADRPTGGSTAPPEFTIRPIEADYEGQPAHLIESKVAKPLSLAAADFDEDGVPDLVVGYGDGAAGLFAVHRGNLEAIYPRAGEEAGPAFLAEAQVFSAAHRPDHIAAGDFDADGHFDVVTAMTGGSTLALRRGTGDGRFAAAELVELGGRVTAFASGEVNRRDGLADIVIGVDRSAGPAMLVFEHPLGALRGVPETIETTETVTSVELGYFDDDWMRDIAATTASHRITAIGRDRRLSLGRTHRDAVAPPTVAAEPSPTSTDETKRSTSPAAARIDGTILAHLVMRLNRDALPDAVVITGDTPEPLVVKTLSRSTFTVDSTADDADFSTADGVCDTDDSVGDGPCTFRAAIEQANASPGADAVEFDIPGVGPHTIQPSSTLPSVSDTLTIDGTTEPDFAGTPIVEIDGAGAGTDITCLYLTATDTTIRGLVIKNVDRDGIVISSTASGAIIEGNYLGIDSSGTSAAPITRTAIANYGAADMTIGGTVPAARNVVSGTKSPLVVAPPSSTSSVIQGNYFGTDASGSSSIPNTSAIGASAPGITVGGAVPGAGNVITGASIGVNLLATGVEVYGNFIGTNASGTAALPNTNWGIGLGAADVTIGGTSPLHRNVISGNGADGISISGPSATGAVIQGNFIGLGSDGVTPLGNGRHGLVFGNSGGDNSVGGSVAGSGNTIAHNVRDGVLVHTHDTSIPILGNSIHSNGEEGIDLDWQMYTYGDGVTPNDPGDPDTGGNNLQNFPVITLINLAGTTIDGTLNSLASTQFALEFFANSVCDPSGHGEGEAALGTGTVTTDGAGDGSFSVLLPGAIPAGSYVTATATDPDDNTSEFSACVQYTVEADLSITKDDGAATVIAGTQTTYTIIASNATGPGPVSGAVVADAFPPELTCTWTCVAAGSATCTAGPVAGDINDTIDLPVGGSATYTAVCSVTPATEDPITNTATVTPPPGVIDPTPGNNSSTDVTGVIGLDFGDAPDPSYPTLFANDGARHVFGSAVYLGSTIDVDFDGQPTATADGDDTDGNDDDDGIVFMTPLVTGYTATVDVTASSPSLLNAWLDFNADGDWDDTGEQVFTDEALVVGNNSFGLAVPGGASLGHTYARFRVDTGGGLTPTGLAMNGEVEDEALEIRFSSLDIAKTGQTAGYAAGDDGTFQAGIAWPDPRFTDNSDGTMTDELTGLMWTQDNDTPGPPVCVPNTGKNWFDSLSHVDCLNAEAYLGYTDWRMPNIIELQSLVNHSVDDHNAWWASQGFTLAPGYYWWSGDTSPSGLLAAWRIDFSGNSTPSNKSSDFGMSVWPVRGTSEGGAVQLHRTGQVRCWDASYAEVPCDGTGQDGDHLAGLEWPSPRFEVSGDCVTDRMTGLVWAKDANLFGERSWFEALNDALTLNLCGFDDWRLPNARELTTLYHFDKRMGSVPPTMKAWWDSQGFVNTPVNDNYWSSTTDPRFPDTQAMIMTGGAANKTSSSYLVWPVRGNLLHDIADLGISMSDADDPVAPGDPITYTLDVENLGPNTAAEVTVTGALPAGSAFVSAAGPGWACSEDTGVVTCSATGLGIGAAPSITVEIDAPSTPGTISTTFLVDSLQGDPVGDNNSDTEETDVAEYDFGDAPDPTYPTLQASNGARHVIGGSLYLGAAVDADADGQPTATANGDDTDPEGDDEDGITFTSWLVAGWTADIRITASEAGLVNAWIDFNADGDWSDPGEQIFADQAVVGGANNLTYTIPLNAMTGVDTYARFRINSSGGLSPEGEAADGEVEDHHVMIEALDYGDAPDPTYPTLQASDGARHIIGGLFLGASVDLEADGQPTAGADGDDLDGTDDEDGVVLTAGLTAGSSAPVDVTASGAGLLNAWVDLNADGDWDDTGEQIFTDEAVVAGVNSLSFAVPLDAALGTTFARFRLSTTPGLGFDGYATDGEVEDHAVDIVAPDLKMVVDDWPDPIPDGHRLTYFLRVHNEGQLDADGVTLTDTLPADGLFAAASHAGCSETGGVVTCNLGTIAAGTKVEVEVEFDIADGFVGTLTNDAVVTTTTPEPDTSNNTATETTTVVEEATFVHSGNFETGDLTGWIVVGLVP